MYATPEPSDRMLGMTTIKGHFWGVGGVVEVHKDNSSPPCKLHLLFVEGEVLAWWTVNGKVLGRCFVDST